MGDRFLPNNSQGKKQEVEDHRRNFKFSYNKTSVTVCNDSLNVKPSNVNFVYVTCGKCVLNDNHDMCVLHYINGVNSRTRMLMVVPISTREPKRTVNQSVATPLREQLLQNPLIRKKHWWYPKFTPSGYKWKPKSPIGNVNANVSMPLGNASRTANILKPMTPRCSTMSNTPLSSNPFSSVFSHEIYNKTNCCDSGSSKHMTGNLKLLSNFVEKFLGTVKFGNDQIAPILGYGDLKSTCYIRDLRGNDLLTGSRGTDLYSISLQEKSTPIPIFLMAKATSLQAWLWHRRLSHLNFDTINLLSKNDIVTGLPKLKFVKDHLCSSCELGKAKRKSFHTKTTPNSFKGDFMLKRNRTLVEAARTMLSAAKVPLFFWAEAIATTCFTQNRSLVIPRYEKTPYHVINGRKPSVKFFHIFGSLCYIVRDGEKLDKMKEKGDACIFVGYSNQSRAYRVYNKRTRVIVETIHVNFDELPQMMSDHVNSDPVPQCSTTALEQDSLSPGPQSQENVPQAAETVTMSNELDLLFSMMFNEILNGTTPVVSKSSAVTTTDAPNQRQQQHTTPSTSTTVAADKPPLNIQTTPETTSQAPTQVPTVTANENIIQVETNKEYAQVDEDEFINVFSTQNKTSARNRWLDVYVRTHPKGYAQKEGIDFKESFAPVARLEAV
ncbi:retrovirus-related pol polyprotein from transposon TNT 1-94 [Tanacetum coccineum]